MRFENPIDRRVFLKGAGASFVSSIGNRALAGVIASDVLFASAYKDNQGFYGVVLFDEMARPVSRVKLPERGHDVTFSPKRRFGVAFARRPGNFAVVFDLENQQQPLTIPAPLGRHFYGHGVFSQDGKLLFAAENDFEAAKGVVGIYDATDGFARIGEFSSYGIGPHEVLLHPQHDVLIVANGGIETHPDFGRAKLNVHDMKPSLVFMDARTGDLIEKHTLSTTFHKLSIRHMDVSNSSQVVFGGQYEGPSVDTPPLVGSVRMGEDIALWNMREEVLQGFGNYVGSVAFSGNSSQVAFTLPKGNKIAIADVKSRNLLTVKNAKGFFGIASRGTGFVATSETGAMLDLAGNQSLSMDALLFDNHIAKYHQYVK